MDESLSRGMRSYLMRQRTRVTWAAIAKRLGYSSIEGARSGAYRYAKRSKLPWPVPTLTKGFMYYQAFMDGEPWAEIAYDFNDNVERVINCARVWANRYHHKWPARHEEDWEKKLRSRVQSQRYN